MSLRKHRWSLLLLGALASPLSMLADPLHSTTVLAADVADRDAIPYRDDAMPDPGVAVAPMTAWYTGDAGGVDNGVPVLAHACGDAPDPCQAAPFDRPGSVPEPAMYGMLLGGLGVLAGAARRRPSCPEPGSRLGR